MVAQVTDQPGAVETLPLPSFDPPETDDLTTGRTRASTPDARARANPQSVRRPPVVVRRWPRVGPMPPPRPWGSQDADSETPPAQVADPAIVSAPVVQPQVASVPPTSIAPSVGRTLVMLVRPDVRRPQDLDGRRIAVGSAGEGPDQLRDLVQRQAGVTLKPVDLAWTPGLQGLARGDVDGVLLSLGPALSSTELQGIALGNYQVLQIPLGPDAR
ncbi:MAG: hypothetical protein JWL62_2783 [Hyphomicrobiales bacterium]|nr:hypothetical protein [Hyphomicrobiales bacterium]